MFIRTKNGTLVAESAIESISKTGTIRLKSGADVISEIDDTDHLHLHNKQLLIPAAEGYWFHEAAYCVETGRYVLETGRKAILAWSFGYTRDSHYICHPVGLGFGANESYGVIEFAGTFTPINPVNHYERMVCDSLEAARQLLEDIRPS